MMKKDETKEKELKPNPGVARRRNRLGTVTPVDGCAARDERRVGEPGLQGDTSETIFIPRIISIGGFMSESRHDIAKLNTGNVDPLSFRFRLRCTSAVVPLWRDKTTRRDDGTRAVAHDGLRCEASTRGNF